MDSGDIFPTIEESSFYSNFQCCGRSLKDLHELLHHYEDSHVRIEDGDDETFNAGMFDFDTVLAADSLLNVGAEASTRVSGSSNDPQDSDSFKNSKISGSTALPIHLNESHRNFSYSKRPRILTLGIEPCDYASDDSDHLSAFDNTVIRPMDSQRYNSHSQYTRIAPKRSQSVPALPNFPLIHGENGFKLIHSILSSTADPPSSDNPNASIASSNSSSGAILSSSSLSSTHSSSSYGHRSSSDRPFVCPVAGCGKTYKNANGLKYHAIHGHDGVLVEKPHKCPFSGCGKRYKNSNGLKYHFQHSHPNSPPPSGLSVSSNYTYSSSNGFKSSCGPSSSSSASRFNNSSFVADVPPRPQSTNPTSNSNSLPSNMYSSSESLQSLLSASPNTIANLLKKNPNLKQHLPNILRNLQQIALLKSSSKANSELNSVHTSNNSESNPSNVSDNADKLIKKS
jgi:hypothetical protein